MEGVIGFIIIVLIGSGIVIGILQARNDYVLNRKSSPETIENEKIILDELKQYNFQESKCLEGFLNTKIRIDEINKNIAICRHGANKKFDIIPFANIRDVSIYEDGTEEKKSAISRAIIGGMFAGDAGAIVGASTAKSETIINSYGLKIYTADINNPLHDLPIIWQTTKKDSPEYMMAKNSTEQAFATISAIIELSKTL